MDVKAVITLMDTLTDPSSAEGTARRAGEVERMDVCVAEVVGGGEGRAKLRRLKWAKMG